MQHKNLQTFFQEVAKENAENTALHSANSIYTYRQLDSKANEFAGWIQSRALVLGDVVGIISTKCFEDYALMIACLKLGITYTNIDIDNPTVRTRDICDTCTPKLLFCSQEVSAVSKNTGVTVALYKGIGSEFEPLYSEVEGDTVAYIMFTSGSTGKPKGAAITHTNLVNFIQWGQSRFAISVDDNFANISPMYFDNSVFDFYIALFSGASLTPIKKTLLNDPVALLDHIDKHKCSIWFSVPSMLIYLLTMRVLHKQNLETIRTFIFGGEGFPKTELKKLYTLYSHRAKLVNVYGPTECTCICSSYTISENDFENLDELPPLGRLNEGFSSILDDGELCLIGPNVAKGYYNDKKRSSAVFSTYNNQPMYRTGDLVEEREGLFYFKGRADNQVKHMGYRIELEEIEIALNALAEIQQAIVLHQRHSDSAYGKIVAFIVPEMEELDLKTVKEALRLKLPTYMQPNRFEIRKAFPKNANGKIDRGQLKVEL